MTLPHVAQLPQESGLLLLLLVRPGKSFHHFEKKPNHPSVDPVGACGVVFFVYCDFVFAFDLQ